MIAMDFGANDKLRLHDSTGPCEVEKNTRGLTPDRKFAETLTRLLAVDDVVTESATVGASGAEVELIRDAVESSPHRLYLVSGRVVKNYIKTHGLPTLTDAVANDMRSAEIIYETATTNPDSLRLWSYVPADEKLQRAHTSVRPYDKRNYKDPAVDKYLSVLPEFSSLPLEMQEVWGNSNKNRDYLRATVLPFAMAMDEEGADTRDGYERVIGLYGHGYPSFYRRATVTLMQRVAKKLAGTTRIAEVSAAQRKEAWKITRRHIRALYHAMSAAQSYT